MEKMYFFPWPNNRPASFFFLFFFSCLFLIFTFFFLFTFFWTVPLSWGEAADFGEVEKLATLTALKCRCVVPSLYSTKLKRDKKKKYMHVQKPVLYLKKIHPRPSTLPDLWTQYSPHLRRKPLLPSQSSSLHTFFVCVFKKTLEHCRDGFITSWS